MRRNALYQLNQLLVSIKNMTDDGKKLKPWTPKMCQSGTLTTRPHEALTTDIVLKPCTQRRF